MESLTPTAAEESAHEQWWDQRPAVLLYYWVPNTAADFRLWCGERSSCWAAVNVSLQQKTGPARSPLLCHRCSLLLPFTRKVLVVLLAWKRSHARDQ